jgi:hypothetical protein
MNETLKRLANEIEIAAEKSFLRLFQNQESYYYCTLVTTEEAHPPIISAWSWEAQEAIAKSISKEEAEWLKWSYADSPYFNYGAENFEMVRKLFYEREPDLTDEVKWQKEIDLRINAMVLAMEKLDKKGLFALNQPRDKIYINVEVMPPDESNTVRALQLNKRENILDWLNEAAE